MPLPPYTQDILVSTASVQAQRLTILYPQLSGSNDVLQHLLERSEVADPLEIRPQLILAQRSLIQAMSQIDLIRP